MFILVSMVVSLSICIVAVRQHPLLSQAGGVVRFEQLGCREAVPLE